ncbi:MAG: hypothetical protein WEB00_10795 [Dehalococcoidia bacterium]
MQVLPAQAQPPLLLVGHVEDLVGAHRELRLDLHVRPLDGEAQGVRGAVRRFIHDPAPHVRVLRASTAVRADEQDIVRPNADVHRLARLQARRQRLQREALSRDDCTPTLSGLSHPAEDVGELQQLGHPAARGRGVDPAARAFVDRRALVVDDEAVGQVVGLGQVVGYEEDGQVEPLAQRDQLAAQRPADAGVER